MTRDVQINTEPLTRALQRKAQVLESEIRERKKMEDALHEAERRRDEFLATLAHELRNPLAPIRNATEIIKVADSDPQRIAAARALIERQLNHLVRLIDDLLDVSRVTRGRLTLRVARIDLMSAVHAAVETIQPLLDRKRDRLQIDRATQDALIVNGDLTRLAQILTILVDNGITYSDPDSAIVVRLGRAAGQAVVQVSDQGIGIAPELLPWVFDMFARPSPADIGARSGLGIGLTLVKRLVELHGGSIEAHSEGLNRGSTFTMRLPLAEGAADPLPAATLQPVC